MCVCVCADEPTNFLDKETFNALVRALKSFKGCVLTISHNQEFVDQVASDKWTLENGIMTVQSRKDKESEAEETDDAQDTPNA